jgi:membrane protease YdiL (CAAX protease family)
MDDARKPSITGLILRVGVFAFLGYAGLWLLAGIFLVSNSIFVAAAMGTFAAAAIANAVAVRIWERGQLTDIGFHWNRDSRWNLALGLGAGAGAALLVLAPPLVFRLAELQKDPQNPGNAVTVLFISTVLLFGAIGEEMLFRGYGFQVLVAALGPYATILPISILFGVAHLNNVNATAIGIANTIGWGAIFGVAFLRSGDLWLPIGMHFGWNVTLPLFGVNLSGFTMGATGYVMNWKVGSVWSGGGYGPEAGLLTTLVMIPLVWFLLKAPIRHQRAWLLRETEEDV